MPHYQVDKDGNVVGGPSRFPASDTEEMGANDQRVIDWQALPKPLSTNDKVLALLARIADGEVFDAAEEQYLLDIKAEATAKGART